MTAISPWKRGPFELLLHAEMHYRNGEDFDRRISMVGYDNAIEVSIHTYLNLKPMHRNGKIYDRSDVERWCNNYHTKIDFIELEVAKRGLTMICQKEEIIWYHELRNSQYHVGGPSVPMGEDLQSIRKVALWIFGLLFEVADVESLLDENLNQRIGTDLPARTDEGDRLIDQEFGRVDVAGRLYSTSELMYALDPVLYSELAVDIIPSARGPAV